MSSIKIRWASLLGLMLLAPAPASAEERRVTVDAKAGPWLNGPNKKMRYGLGDEAPPMTITGFINDADAKIEIYPVEGATTMVEGKPVGPEGIDGTAVNDAPGPKKKYYPSLYAPKILYPTNAHALIGAFVDANGVLIGRPFAIGKGVRVTIPDQAAALTLGFNDVKFAGNSGALPVVVVLPD
ncbi:hypothetical protein [Sphingomonas sp. LM7]|uniref:hypothetical protein n=1 Tax=Sphingomonas sp. LM7 TaxID=1938607 RepID=UPI000983B49A|nr:hypothetical protein [Sphingomonas sp. LM7]AQR72301.1 hypothetical protein BXU08_00230 [Sphingomonas sp. LM7]